MLQFTCPVLVPLCTGLYRLGGVASLLATQCLENGRLRHHGHRVAELRSCLPRRSKPRDSFASLFTVSPSALHR